MDSKRGIWIKGLVNILRRIPINLSSGRIEARGVESTKEAARRSGNRKTIAWIIYTLIRFTKLWQLQQKSKREMDWFEERLTDPHWELVVDKKQDREAGEVTRNQG